MDHVVYLDAKAKEIDNILSGNKKMIIRGATGRKIPYGRVNSGDILYFINNNSEGFVKALAKVKIVFNSEKMSPEESKNLIEKNQEKLKLTDKQLNRWIGKRYLVLIEIDDVVEVIPFKIDKTDYGNMDDWLIVEDINKVK
ncbi:MAG: hypothetical protein AMQ22_01750 [Candidatus Methanofastidiosum methylothiophilum]|uniref:ASCH domain-containing protein n=1 Tax=Candidatus Methanofastidiosum methylothiophilum TaxID=1705564 RepID=A0A150IVR8_9EURY|nr:MAG: hypothetical protein AMQ22_01750 [Candidatus Methanofastidiosum methylthiophilus]